MSAPINHNEFHLNLTFTTIGEMFSDPPSQRLCVLVNQSPQFFSVTMKDKRVETATLQRPTIDMNDFFNDATVKAINKELKELANYTLDYIDKPKGVS